MKGLIFKLFGVGVILLQSLTLLVTANQIMTGRLTPNARVFVGEFIATSGALLVGIGLLLLRKWAAILLSITSTSVGLWLIVGSLLHVPLPWMFINVGNGLGFFVPAVASYLCWRDLSWKG
jgi:hypothetical protein